MSLVRRLPALVCLLVLLDACTVPGPNTPYLTFMGIEATAANWTDKTLTDRLASAISGKNCSALRAQNTGYYCEEDMRAAPPAPYCYKTLGNVTCYSQPSGENIETKVGVSGWKN